MAHYLVTGGAGFIGSHIVYELIKSGNKVRVLDNFSSGKEENLKAVFDKIELVKGDIRDVELLKKVTSGVDYCLHQAALRSVPKSVQFPQEYNDVNISGTLNVLLAAKENKVKRVVFASSSSVYGDVNKFPQSEKDLTLLISPYALTKLAGEYWCRVFSKQYGLETVSLRYFNVFGPRQSLDDEYAVVIPKFIVSVLRGEPPPIYGDGKQSRDFTFVENVVQANILAAKKEGVAGMVFNIACGCGHTVIGLAEAINSILGKNIKPVFLPVRPGDVKKTLADINCAKKYLGFEPGIDFEAGIKRTVEWFKERYKKDG